MLYDVYIQGQLYKTVDVQFTQHAITEATLAIQGGLVPGYDDTLPQNIGIRPAVLSKPGEDAAPVLEPPAAD